MEEFETALIEEEITEEEFFEKQLILLKNLKKNLKKKK